MKVSGQTQLALRMMLVIGENAPGQGLTQRKEIVKKLQVNDAYVEQILLKLKQAGLVYTVRGRNGGCRLGRGMEDITLKEVFEAFEGDTAEVGDGGGRGGGSPADAACRGVWSDMGNVLAEYLGGVTLADVRDREHRAAPEYVI